METKILNREELKKRFENERVILYDKKLKSSFSFYTVKKDGKIIGEKIFVRKDDHSLLKLNFKTLNIEKIADEDLKLISESLSSGLVYYFEKYDIYLYTFVNYSDFLMGFKKKGEEKLIAINFEDDKGVISDERHNMLAFFTNGTNLYILTKNEIKKFDLLGFLEKLVNNKVEFYDDFFSDKFYINLGTYYSNAKSFKFEKPLNVDSFLSYTFDVYKEKIYLFKITISTYGWRDLSEVFTFDMKAETYGFIYMPLFSENIGYMDFLYNNNPDKFFRIFRVIMGIKKYELPVVYLDEKLLVYVEDGEEISEKKNLIYWNFENYDMILEEADEDDSYMLLKDYKLPPKKEIAKKRLINFFSSYKNDNDLSLKFVYENFKDMAWGILKELNEVKEEAGDFKYLLDNFASIFKRYCSEEDFEKLLNQIGYSLKQKWVCKDCGTKNPKEKLLCEKCGKSLFDEYKENYEKEIVEFTMEKIPYAFIYFKTMEESENYLNHYNNSDVFDIDSKTPSQESMENTMLHLPLLFDSFLFTVKGLNSTDLKTYESEILREYAKMFYPILFNNLEKSENVLKIARWLLIAIKDENIMDSYITDIGNYKIVEFKDFLIDKLNEGKYLESVVSSLVKLGDKNKENIKRLRYLLKNETDDMVLSEIIDYFEELKGYPDFKELFYLFSIFNYKAEDVDENELSIISKIFENLFYAYDKEEVEEEIEVIRDKIEAIGINEVFIFFILYLIISEKSDFDNNDLRVIDEIGKILFSETGKLRKYISKKYVKKIANRKSRLKALLDFLAYYFSEDIDFEYKFIVAVVFVLVKGILPSNTKYRSILDKIILLLTGVLERGYNQYDDFRKVLAATCLLELGVDRKWEDITIELLEKSEWEDWKRIYDLGVKVLSYLKNSKDLRYLSLLVKYYELFKDKGNVEIQELLLRIAEISPQKAIEFYERDNLKWDIFTEAKLYAYAGVKKNYEYILENTINFGRIEGLEVISMLGDDERCLKILEDSIEEGAPGDLVKRAIKNVKKRLAQRKS